MAIPDTLAARLIETVKTNALEGAFLMLGRQRWIGTRKVISGRFLRQTLKDHMPGITEDDLVNPDNPYSETFFTKLGFQSVDSMDMSDFEGASIIQDLAGRQGRNLG